MKVGVSLCPEAGRWRDTVAQARLAEELGYDSVWLPEHHLMAGYAPSPLLGLAGLVEVTERVLLGTDVLIVPFAHPVRLAEDAAVLHDMSGGRFVFGAGLGYRREEFAAFGVPYGQRGQILDESLEIVRRLWREEEVHFAGRHFGLDGVTIHPRLDTPPPLWIGGWAEAALRRAARLGDAWFPGPTADLEKVRACLEVYDAELAGKGRVREELPIFREVWVADGPELLEAGVQALRAMYAADYLTWGHSNVVGSDDVARNRFIVGDPEQVTAALVRLGGELRVTHLIARMHFHGIAQDAVEASMRLFADEVLPQVRGAVARA
jgi:probable F420-dependent oxidoreductase